MLVFTSQYIVQSFQVSRALADGVIASTAFFLNFYCVVCLVFPASLGLRGYRYLSTMSKLAKAVTPRQRFHGETYLPFHITTTHAYF